MAAHRLCERMVELGLHERYEITVLGAETSVPYDRVRLGEALGPHGSVHALRLRDSSWYAEHGISLLLGADVTGVERHERAVFDARGRRFDYDLLVLATGSEPRMPGCVSGLSERVHLYREYRDAEAIKAHIEASALAPHALVLGGGLLGIELASVLKDRGCSVTMYEAASHLLSRQLDIAASRRLLNALRSDAIQVELNVHVESLRSTENGAFAERGDGTHSHFDFAVVAVGVVPRDRIARGAGLRCWPGRGVVVDGSMRTSDPHIYAVGECASVDGTPFGLVAPCYEMVESLAQGLAGNKRAFRRAPLVTKLKYERLPTAVVGDALVDEPGFESYLAETQSSYRRLVVRRGKLVGATSVGSWDEWPSVLAAAVGKRRFGVAQRARFTAGKELWNDESCSVRNWASEVPLCSCTGASCAAVRAAIQDGCESLGALSARTGAGTVCGSCTPLLEQLLDPAAKPLAPRAQRALAAVGLLAVVVTLMLFIVEPVGWAQTFQNDWRPDVLWRNKTVRQVTGFTLAGLCALSLLLSARKRICSFRVGAYGTWRLVHSLVGVAMLAGLGIHTGFRFGANLNSWLMLTFVLVTALGGLSAIAAALEHHFPAQLGGAIRRRTLLVHQILFWPFPLLVFIHALKSFYF